MMHFAAGSYVYLLALIPALLGLYVYHFARKRKDLAAFMALALTPQLLPGYSRLRQWTKACCVMGAVACLVFALMQPQWGRQWQELPRRGRDLILLLDVSLSMRAEDVQPNRLERAKIDVTELVQLLQKEGGHRLGLVAFAGRASLLCPPTFDYPFFLQQLREASPDLVPQEGTSIGDAIRRVLSGFGALDRAYTDMILITDGEDHGSTPLEAAQAATQHRVTLYTVGVGDAAQGAPIPMPDQGREGRVYAQYRGQMVQSRMQQSLLIEMAQLTGGEYQPASMDSLGLKRLYRNHIATKARRDIDVAPRERLVPRYHGFVVAALLFLMLEMILRDRRDIVTKAGRE